jgi:hypothetical protein
MHRYIHGLAHARDELETCGARTIYLNESSIGGGAKLSCSSEHHQLTGLRLNQTVAFLLDHLQELTILRIGRTARGGGTREWVFATTAIRRALVAIGISVSEGIVPHILVEIQTLRVAEGCVWNRR